jgi:hypothetical protein
MSPPREHNPRSVPCPRCGARAGQPCRGAHGSDYHGARIAAARGAESGDEREHKLRVAREMFRP